MWCGTLAPLLGCSAIKQKEEIITRRQTTVVAPFLLSSTGATLLLDRRLCSLFSLLQVTPREL
jgi:hypothetical protein